MVAPRGAPRMGRETYITFSENDNFKIVIFRKIRSAKIQMSKYRLPSGSFWESHRRSPKKRPSCLYFSMRFKLFAERRFQISSISVKRFTTRGPMENTVSHLGDFWNRTVDPWKYGLLGIWFAVSQNRVDDFCTTKQYFRRPEMLVPRTTHFWAGRVL